MPIAANRVAALQASLDGKDAAGLTALGADAYQPLIAAAGPVDQALKRLRAFGAGDALDTRLDAVSILVEPLRARAGRSEEHTSELQSLMRLSYAVFCLKKQNKSFSIHTRTSI